MHGKPLFKKNIYFCNEKSTTFDMKMKTRLLKSALLLLAVVSLASCNKQEEISIVPSLLWFPAGATVQELEIKANCRWSITIDDGADWYTISPMSGRKNKKISVTAQALNDNLEERTSSFTITSSKGKVKIQVRVSQNTDEPLELESITDMVFAVASVSHWNVDYWGNVIPETYKHKEYDPFDTTKGYLMYFFQDGDGIQKDSHGDSTVYYAFKYEYFPDSRILHLDFETVGEATEIYDAPVLSATIELFRIQHEYLPMRWEISDMRRIGTLAPVNSKARLMRKATKRKGDEPVFQF